MYGFIPETRNLARSLAAAAFTVSPGPNDSTRSRLNDKRVDRTFNVTASAAPVSIVVDLGSAQAVDTVAVLNHNLASIGSSQIINVNAADDSAITTGVVAVAVMTLSGTMVRTKDTCCSFATVTKRYWQFEFDWTGGSEALSVGELFLGVATTLSRGEQDGSGETEMVRAPTVELSNGGSRGIFLAGPVLQRSLLFSDFSASELATLRTLWRDCRGPVVPLLWCESWVAAATRASPTDAQMECLYGHLEMPDFGWRWSDWQLVKPPDIVIRALGREVGA